MTSTLNKSFWLTMLALAGILALAAPTGALPWAGDCQKLERLAYLVKETQSGGALGDKGIDELVPLLTDRFEPVFASLAAFILGRCDAAHPQVRPDLVNAVEFWSALDDSPEFMPLSFARYALTMTDLHDASEEDKVATLREILETEQGLFAVLAARTLLEKGVVLGVKDRLLSLSQTAGVHRALAKATIDQLEGNAPALLSGEDDLALVIGIIDCRLSTPPCLGLMNLLNPYPPLVWQKNCDEIRQFIEGLSSGEWGTDVLAYEHVVAALRGDDPILGSISAYVIGQVGTDATKLVDALDERLRNSTGEGPDERLVKGFCRFALLKLRSNGLLTDEKIARLWELASAGEGIASAIAAGELIAIG